MKLKFKTQAYQTAAVQTVVDCFKGQPPASSEAISYRIDPGKAKKGIDDLFTDAGFKNADLVLSDAALLDNIQQVQRTQNLPISDALVKTKVARVNLDIEMETGTGKTYCYIKTATLMPLSTSATVRRVSCVPSASLPIRSYLTAEWIEFRFVSVSVAFSVKALPSLMPS